MPKADFIYEDPLSGSQVTGSTPYGIYDDDTDFVTDSLNITKWVARRLGHPVMQLEIPSGSIYACYEEAVSEYSQQINQYNMKNWFWNDYANQATGSAYSGSTQTEFNNPKHPGGGASVFLSDQYGEAIAMGGGISIYTGSLVLTSSKQEYDLQNESRLEGSGHSSQRLEIQKVFNFGPAAITRFYDPFAGSFEQRQMLDAFGMGNVSPAVSFIMRPISYDIARSQAIETNDKIRKSNYSFDIVNNKMRIFPVPRSSDAGDKVYFNYFVRGESKDTSRSFTSGKVSDPSNAPYKFIKYRTINSAGRQWIRKYALALAKELLGIIRSKYASMPLPNGEVSMDGEALKAEGREEKNQMLDELKEFLESVSLSERTRQEQEQAEAQQQVLNKAPLGIYIG